MIDVAKLDKAILQHLRIAPWGEGLRASDIAFFLATSPLRAERDREYEQIRRRLAELRKQGLCEFHAGRWHYVVPRAMMRGATR